MEKKFFKNILLSLFIFQLLLTSNTQCMLKNIKGTVEVVHDEYKHLSLVHGAIAWETGIIRRLYDFGKIFPVYSQNAQGVEIITGYELLNHTHATVRLIHTLFYRVPGSTGESDFGPTKQLLVENPLSIAQTIADILALCSEICLAEKAFKDAINILTKGLDVAWQEKSLLLIAKPLSKDPDKKSRDLSAVFIQACEENFDLAKTIITKSKKSEYLSLIKKFVTNLSSIAIKFNQLLKSPARLGSDMGPLILDSLRECNQTNQDALFPANTTQMVLLAFVYKQCGDNRMNFKAFYEKLNNHFNQRFLKVGIWTSFDMTGLSDAWVNNSFDLIDQETALSILNAIFAQGQEYVVSNLDAVLYYSQRIRSLPTLVGYSTTTYAYEPGRSTPLFSDCMDNTIRNLINMLCYEAEQNRFNLNLLKKRLNIATLNPKLEEFYTLFSDVNESQSPKAHQAWIEVISNIPYAAYIKASDMPVSQNISISAKKWGYIPIPENDKENVALMSFIEKNYDSMLTKNYGYELEPSIRNIIIVLNHLFNLDLFEDNLADTFPIPLFIKKYFPLMCKKLVATAHYQSLSFHDKNNDDSQDFDALDFSDEQIFSTIVFQQQTTDLKFSCQIMTKNKHHGELYVSNDFSPQEKLLFQLFKEDITKVTNQSCKLLMTNILCRQSLDFSHLIKYEQTNDFLSLFTTPLEDPEITTTILKTLKSKIEDGMSQTARQQLRELLLYRTVNHPNQDQAIGNVIEMLVSDEHEVELVVENALILITSKDSDYQYLGYLILKILVASGYKPVFDRAADSCLAAIKAGKAHLKYIVLEIYVALIDQNYYPVFEQAAILASSGIQSNDSKIQYIALKIYIALVNKRFSIVFNQAVKAATTACQSQEKAIQNSGLTLFVVLLNQQIGFEEAIQPIANARKSTALLMIEKMFHEKNFIPALKAVIKASQSKNTCQRLAGLKLFMLLVEKNYQGTFNNALNAGAEGLIWNDQEISSLSFNLLQTLLNQNYQFETKIVQKTLQASFQATKSTIGYMKLHGLKMVSFLVTKNVKSIFNKALETAAHELDSNNQEIANSALILLQNTLLKEDDYDFNEQIFNYALDKIYKATQSESIMTQINGLKMILFLVKHNHDYLFETALSLARKFLASSNPDIVQLCRVILDELSTKGYSAP